MAKADFETIVINMLTELTGKVGKLEGKVDKIEGKVDKLEGKLESEVGRLEGKIDNLEGKVDKLEGKLESEVGRLEGKIDNLTNEVDIMKNVNLATILNGQQEMRKELNDKLDKFIKINEVEHKKFDYKISELELRQEVAENSEKYNLDN